MKIIVNDANILIDLVELKLLPYFFKLNFEFHTTELILAELIEEQKEALVPYIETGKLILRSFTALDFQEINTIHLSKPNLSEQDCSAFFHAKNENATLLTSDNTLRKYAKSMNIEVHGHLWVFDNLFDNNLLSGQRLIEKLDELCVTINPKLGLPKAECRKRTTQWNVDNS